VGVISALLEGKTLHQAVRAATRLARWPFRCRATAKDYPHEHSSNKFPLWGGKGAAAPIIKPPCTLQTTAVTTSTTEASL
jgi:hypothetical protein